MEAIRQKRLPSDAGPIRSLPRLRKIQPMNDKITIAPFPQKKPVRVRLKRINANLAQAYPPAGETKEWWTRLKSAMGTASSDFVNATLFQLQNAARLPNGGISEIAVNAALSMVETVKPKDEVEAALIIQMACTHAAAMAVLSRIGGGHGGDRHVAMMAAAASKLLRSFAVQVETLRRSRGGGSQYMRIEHVHVGTNAQAIIGNLQRRSQDSE